MIQTTFFDQKTSQEFDAELMSEEVGFTLDILMELAGQSVANAVYEIGNFKKVLCLCGPGNNGGDGIVAARHLKQYGIDVTVAIFKNTFPRLINTCKANEITIEIDPLKKYPDFLSYMDQFDLIIDSLFGFSYKPPMREPYKTVIQLFKQIEHKVFSVDIPSGWDVEKGNIENLFNPAYLISLTLPKLGVKDFNGRHFLGGRFIPKSIEKKYNLSCPQYEGSKTIIELKGKL